jgi:hypothetical protein
MASQESVRAVILPFPKTSERWGRGRTSRGRPLDERLAFTVKLTPRPGDAAPLPEPVPDKWSRGLHAGLGMIYGIRSQVPALA